MRIRFCHERGAHGFSWIVDEPATRTSHALAVDGRVWIVDPVDHPDAMARVAALGEPAGVVQLLDRHARDCRLVAEELGVPHHVVPGDRVGPFEMLPIVRSRLWREVALWWPERAVLVCGDAAGTAPYLRARGEALAVHPLLRVRPPRRLADLEPRHVLCGHGAGVHGDDAAPALREALATARRRLPAAWLNAARGAVRSRASENL
jgi:hypothetical protein